MFLIDNIKSKHVFFYLFLLIYNFNLVAQNKTDSFQQHVVKQEDKVFSAFLTDSIGAGSIDVLISCHDTSGNQQWSKTYGGGSTELVNGLLLKDSILFVYGRTKSSTIGSDDFYILALDYNGNFIDEIIFGTAGYDVSKDLVFDNQSIYFLGSSGVNTILSNISFDSSQFYIENVIEISSVFNQYAEIIIIDSIGNVIIAGNIDSVSGDQKDVFCLKLNAQNDVVFSNTFGDQNSQEISNGTIDNFRNLYFGGNSENSGDKEVLIIKIDKDGNQILNKSFGTFLIDKSYDLEFNEDKIYVGGYTQSITGSYDDAFIVELDSNLIFKNKMRIERPNDEYLTTIGFERGKTTISGPFKISGSSTWNYFSSDLDSNFLSCNLVEWEIDSFSSIFNQSEFTINIDTIFLLEDTISFLLESQNVNFTPKLCNIIIPFDTVIEDTTDNDTGVLSKVSTAANILIYPVPANDKVVCVSKETISKLEIFNMFGKSILSISNINSKTIELNINKYPKGIYTIVFEEFEGRIIKKLIID